MKIRVIRFPPHHFMDFPSINFLAVLVAAIAAFFIGFMWHGPVFGKQWLKLKNISPAEVAAAQAKGMASMVPQMIAALVMQIVVAGVMAHIAGALGLTDAVQALFLAVLVWLGFYVTVLLNAVLWEKESLALYFFRLSYNLVVLIVISMIVVLWR